MTPSVVICTMSVLVLRLTTGTSSVNVVEPASTVSWIVTVTRVPIGDAVVVISLPVKVFERKAEE